jgi:hypothetical protein
MSEFTGILEERGIADVAAVAQWKVAPLRKDNETFHGWQYPVFRVDGSQHERPRWKNSNGNGPKYYWPKGQPEGAKYYFLPGLKSAVQQANGMLFIAGGEPDVLVYHSAGIKNVFCWLAAETSVPDTLAQDLAYLGVSNVVYAPDRDITGMRSAYKVREALKDADMQLFFLELPGEMGSKYDVNDLWKACEFGPKTFYNKLWSKEIDAIDLELYGRTTGNRTLAQTQVQTQVGDWYGEWTQTVTAALGTPAKTSGGRSWWHCPLPGHDDKDPSFRITNDKNKDFGWPICSCGFSEGNKGAWDDVAAALNVDDWQTFKAHKAAASGVDITRPRTKRAALGEQSEDVKLWVSGRTVYAQLISELKGEKEPEGIPIQFPYKTLRTFGGFAEYLWTGKTVGLGGISGGGKTMLLKSLFQVFIRLGYHVIWWGPEWSPAEYGWQDLQRAGGLNFKQVNQLNVAKAMARKHGITFAAACAKYDLIVPGQAAIDESIRRLEKMQNMRGDIHYITDMRANVEDVMSQTAHMAHNLRTEGKDVVAFGFDYAQLANMPGKRDWSWGKRVIAEIKAGVAPSEANVVGFVGIQSRKSDSQDVREGKKLLTQDAAQGTDEHPFNLYMTITPVFNEGRKLNYGYISVEKNSMGDTGRVPLYINWPRLTVLDERVPDSELPKTTTVHLNGGDR